MIFGVYTHAATVDKEKSESRYYIEHLKETELSRTEKAKDKKKPEKSEIILAVYDLQAVLPVPSSKSSAFFYKFRLNCYNFTITEIANDKTCCFF